MTVARLAGLLLTRAALPGDALPACTFNHARGEPLGEYADVRLEP